LRTRRVPQVSLLRPGKPQRQIHPLPVAHKCRVPHPFRFFLRKGWETKTPNHLDLLKLGRKPCPSAPSKSLTSSPASSTRSSATS
jgi:hypothetical protein